MDSAVLPTPAWLRGGSRPLHVALAVILGAVAGATAGWNLTFALLVTLALLHHGPFITTVVAGAIACAAVNVGSNLTTAVGSFCCEKIGLGSLIESLGHGPLVSLLGWHSYDLLGGAILALILSLPAAHALARRRPASNEDDAEPVAAPLFRPWGCTAALLWVVAAAATLHTAAPQHVGQAFLKQLSAATGAPVTADRMQYDLFAGRLELNGVRVSDLDEPGRVAFRIDTVTAEVEPGLLLRGRLHAERIELAGLTYDADPHTASPPKLFRSEQPAPLRESLAADAARSSDATQPVEATSFLRNWNHLTARMSALGRLIVAIEGTADLEIVHAVAAQRLQAARRPALEPGDAISGRTLPLVQIKHLQIAGLPSGWSLGEEARVELVNLTSRPSTTPRGVQLTLEAPSRHTQLTIDFHLSSGDRRHDVSLTCDSCPAGDLVDLRHAAAVGLETTATPTLALRGRGSVGRDRVELALACDVVGFRPTATAPRFGNLDAAVWRAGIDRLGGLRLDATLAGHWSDPHFQVTPAAIVDQLKHQLRSVGEHVLVKAVEAGRIGPPPAPPVAAKSEAKSDPKSDAAPSSAVAAALQVATTAQAKSPPVAGKTITVTTNETPAVAAPSVAAPQINAPSVTAQASAIPAAAVPSSVTSSLPPAPIAPAPFATPPAIVNPEVAAKPTPSNVVPATAVAELRQPASVLDPSSRPGQASALVGGMDPFAAAVARTRPTAPPPIAASKPTTATPTITAPSTVRPSLPPTSNPTTTRPSAGSSTAGNSSAGNPSANKPIATRPSTPLAPSEGAAVVISDDASPGTATAPRTSMVNNWFDSQKPAETASPTIPENGPTTQRSLPEEPEQTASKPWFPRVRKLLAPEEQDDEKIATAPADTFAERTPSPRTGGNQAERPSAQQPSVEVPVPQTAKSPWYQRMFR